MVMLKILQQHYNATGDPRVVDCLKKYFRYQLETLPDKPLEAPPGGKGGSWWAAQRGGDNLMVVLWFYNLTGEKVAPRPRRHHRPANHSRHGLVPRR